MKQVFISVFNFMKKKKIRIIKVKSTGMKNNANCDSRLKEKVIFLNHIPRHNKLSLRDSTEIDFLES